MEALPYLRAENLYMNVFLGGDQKKRYTYSYRQNQRVAIHGVEFMKALPYLLAENLYMDIF